MPEVLRSFLCSRAALGLARVVLTFPFWGSGLDKLINFSGGVAEMRMFGLEPAVAFNIAVIIVELGGSALVIGNRAGWLGAGALGVFTALCIPVVHHFWSLDGEHATVAFHMAAEHVGLIGALLGVAILSARPSRARTPIEIPQVVMAR